MINSTPRFLLVLVLALLGAAAASLGAERPGGEGGERGEVVLVASRGENTVTVLAAADLAHLATIDIGLGAHELAVSPDGRLAAGTAYGGPGPGHQPADNRVAIIDLSDNTLLRTIDLGERMRPNDLVFFPDNRHVLVTSEMTDELLKIDAREGTVVRAYKLPHKAGHMLAVGGMGADGVGRAYVSHVMEGAVSVVDLGTGEVVKVIAAASGAEGIACSPDGKRVWCANNRAESVTVIDAEKGEAVRTFGCGGFPFRVRFTHDGARVLIACPKSGELAVFDVADGSLVHRIAVTDDKGAPNPPTSIAASGRERVCFAVCPKANEVVRIDLETRAITHRFTPGAIADGLAVGRGV